MESKFKNIFTPIRINKMILKNRVIALSGVSADTVKMFGGVTAAEQIAKGGASLIVTCMADVDEPKSNFYPGSQYTLRKSERDKIRSYVNRIHQYGAKYMLEIDHVGEYYRAEENDFSFGTSDKINEKGIHVKAINENEMEYLAKAFAKTAKDAIELGFDAILFDCSGGWLVSQFISPFYNKRTDEYGGPIENRSKFPQMILREIRKVTGKDFPIMVGISANEYFETDSTPFEDIIKLIKILEKDVDGVIVGCGNDQTRLQMTKGVSTNLEKFLMNREYTQALKKEVSIPIVLTNGVRLPQEAEEALENDEADMIGMCRPLLADYNWVNKAKENKEQDITPCLRCNQCFHISTDCKHVGCSVNPYYTQTPVHYVTPIHSAIVKKKVVVIGAGPAGISAALAADQCGHEVMLIEKKSEVGGLLISISKEHFKKEIKDYLNYLKYQINKSNIKLELNCEATPSYIKSLNPNRIIVAIGAKENVLSFDCDRQILTATQAINNPEKIGNNIVIIGGGTVGVELAVGYGLIDNKNVSIVEMSSELASTANLIYRPALLDRIEKSDKIKAFTNTQVVGINNEGIIIEHEGIQTILTADTVIASVGMKPKHDEAFSFFGITEETLVVGDCEKSGNIIDATFSGHTSGVNA